MCTSVKGASFCTGIHTAHTGGDDGTCLTIQPSQFATDLHRQFTRWCDDQRQRSASVSELLAVTQQSRGNGQTKCNSFARSGLRRYQKVGVSQCWVRYCFLHGSKRFVALFGKSVGDGLDQRNVLSEKIPRFKYARRGKSVSLSQGLRPSLIICVQDVHDFVRLRLSGSHSANVVQYLSFG